MLPRVSADSGKTKDPHGSHKENLGDRTRHQPHRYPSHSTDDLIYLT